MLINLLKKLFSKQCDHTFKIIDEKTVKNKQRIKKTFFILKCDKCDKKSSFQK